MSLTTSSSTSQTEPFSATWMKNLQDYSAGTVTLSGPVTGSGLGTIYTAITDGAVTNAKLANSSITINGTSVSLGGSITISSGALDFGTFSTPAGFSLNMGTF